MLQIHKHLQAIPDHFLRAKASHLPQRHCPQTDMAEGQDKSPIEEAVGESTVYAADRMFSSC